MPGLDRWWKGSHCERVYRQRIALLIYAFMGEVAGGWIRSSLPKSGWGMGLGCNRNAGRMEIPIQEL